MEFPPENTGDDGTETMGNSAQNWKYDQRIPSEPDACAAVTSTFVDQLEKSDWSSKDIFGIHMAMEEALMNAIRHGNECCPNKDVHVIIEISPTRFHARITDLGCGFDPGQVPDPTEDANIEKTTGRGLMLMKNFVDEVVYNDEGNSVELIKNRSN